MNIRLLAVLVATLAIATNTFSQGKGRFSIEAGYGATYNFFVTSQNEIYAPGGMEHLYLYDKENLGTAGGVEISYGISKRASLIAAYNRTVNAKRRSGGAISSKLLLSIEDFNLRHVNTMYLLGYERPLLRSNNDLKFNIGVVYVRPQQQEITIEKRSSGNDNIPFFQVIAQDRNRKNSGLEEMGPFAGVSYQKNISGRFDLGIRARGYYLASTGTFEAITLVPFLEYNF